MILIRCFQEEGSSCQKVKGILSIINKIIDIKSPHRLLAIEELEEEIIRKEAEITLLR